MTQDAAKKLLIKIITPDDPVYEGEAEFIVLPGIEGDIGVMTDHSHLLVEIKTGELVVQNKSDKSVYSVSGGFAEVKDDIVILLADTSEAAHSIDPGRAEDSKKRALKRLKEPKDHDMERANAALIRALNRINIYKNFGSKNA
ncbi:MAG: ATP synthase F1 subunit epsilon [Spirochaetes bacterium]|nr:ATP synthase F1 subunit epsilon [Spirochaetota bacterium]